MGILLWEYWCWINDIILIYEYGYENTDIVILTWEYWYGTIDIGIFI